METMRITGKIQPTTCVLTLFSANADVKIPFFHNVKIVQAYSDTSFLWKALKSVSHLSAAICCCFENEFVRSVGNRFQINHCSER